MKTERVLTPQDEVSDFFKSLGYEVDWDFCHGGGSWWEIGLGGNQICQISMGIPLSHIIEDMSCWAESKEATSPSDWVCSGPESSALRNLFRVVQRAVRGRIL